LPLKAQAAMEQELVPARNGDSETSSFLGHHEHSFDLREPMVQIKSQDAIRAVVVCTGPDPVALRPQIPRTTLALAVEAPP
jgi:hypothetical protein